MKKKFLVGVALFAFILAFAQISKAYADYNHRDLFIDVSGGTPILSGNIWPDSLDSNLEITNPGFEQNVVDNGSWITVVEGWTGVNSCHGTWNPSPGYFNGTQEAPEGSNVAWINSGSLSQILTATYQASTNYELTFASAWRNDYTFQPQFTAELLAGSTMLAMLTNPVSTQGDWSTYHLALPATSLSAEALGIPITIIFTITGGSTQVDLDAVALTSNPVPIPATVLLLGTGIVSLAGIRLQRKRQ